MMSNAKCLTVVLGCVAFAVAVTVISMRDCHERAIPDVDVKRFITCDNAIALLMSVRIDPAHQDMQLAMGAVRATRNQCVALPDLVSRPLELLSNPFAVANPAYKAAVDDALLKLDRLYRVGVLFR